MPVSAHAVGEPSEPYCGVSSAVEGGGRSGGARGPPPSQRTGRQPKQHRRFAVRLDLNRRNDCDRGPPSPGTSPKACGYGGDWRSASPSPRAHLTIRCPLRRGLDMARRVCLNTVVVQRGRLGSAERGNDHGRGCRSDEHGRWPTSSTHHWGVLMGCGGRHVVLPSSQASRQHAGSWDASSRQWIANSGCAFASQSPLEARMP
jgi:hypothetical protein